MCAYNRYNGETCCGSNSLLKNENGLLPLKKDIGTVAVIGPNSDESFVLLGNYNGTPSDPVTPLRGIREKLSGRSEVIYARGCEWVAGMPSQKEAAELKSEALDAAGKADVVIMCMGITPRLEGEEMRVTVDGFRGGDRTRIDLPDVQQELIREIHALGKPVILVLLNGSALAVNWGKEHIPAILEAWYPGQAGGEAIADVIFGDYNPAGRLPVTFYKSEKDLPPFENYRMYNRTYRYFTGEPLYPFGYGLSYTTFKYKKLKVNLNTTPSGTKEVSVKVMNSGKMAGDEVIQVYISSLNSQLTAPVRTLKAFRRIHLLPGEMKTVTIELPADAFSLINEEGKKVNLPGRFEITVGGGQPQKGAGIKETGILKARVDLK